MYKQPAYISNPVLGREFENQDLEIDNLILFDNQTGTLDATDMVTLPGELGIEVIGGVANQASYNVGDQVLLSRYVVSGTSAPYILEEEIIGLYYVEDVSMSSSNPNLNNIEVKDRNGVFFPSGAVT